jgi:hypothetical protein
MNRIRFVAVAGVLLALISVACAQNRNIRGTLAAIDGKMLSVKTYAGDMVVVDIPEGTRISATRPFTLADIKPGMVLGVTTVRRADGAIVAIDVRPIPSTANQGLSPHDLQPESTMTNAVLEAAVEASGAQELTLNYKTGMVKVLVPPGTPMSQAVPGDFMDLKLGEAIFIAAKREEGGKFTALRVQIGKDGVKPTQ